LSLTEVRDVALSKVQQASQAEKLIAELGWRDYWQRVRAARPEGVWHDFETPATRHRGQMIDYLPDTVAHGETGLDCIDAFCRKLTHDGWLHNHERMWLASWLVHTRKVNWRVGAAWFLQHLLDADPASNNFSWQWVAGTFSSKPYIFNRENLERFTAGIYCKTCPAFGHCDFEGTYEQLNEKLFMNDSDEREVKLTIPPVVSWGSSDIPGKSLVWMTLDSLSACSPAKLHFSESPAIFVFDQHWLSDERPSFKRIAFICECLADLPDVEIWFGDTATVLQERAHANNVNAISVANTSCPAVGHVVDRLSSTTPVVPLDWPSFCDASKVKDLGRFSRYWNKVSKTALRPTFTDDRF
jgi:deoxyribodipyrimidine photo-lyase